MDTNLAVAIVAAGASMVTGIFGMWINASQTGKRIDDLRVEFHAFRVEIKSEVKELRTEFATFKDVVNGKLQAIDFEIAKLMDRPK
jgi:16S rRNA C1402 N4-methylase RsmH